MKVDEKYSLFSVLEFEAIKNMDSLLPLLPQACLEERRVIGWR
jgi:hypothetical protein